MINDLRIALTPALSRPTGEGELCGRLFCCCARRIVRKIFCFSSDAYEKPATVQCSRAVRLFPHSHHRFPSPIGWERVRVRGFSILFASLCLCVFLTAIVLTTVVALTSACAAPALAPTNPVPVVLAFDYPTNDLPNVRSFRVYGSTNLSAPTVNWQELTNCWATNLVTTNLSSTASPNAALHVSVTVQPGTRFFVVTSSNFWGESPFSNIAATPPLPSGDINLNAQRGW